MPAYKVYNHADIDAYLGQIANNDKTISRLLIKLLKKPLLSHASSLKPLTQLERNSPGWLRQKFNKGEPLYVFNGLSDPELQSEIRQVANWVALAIKHNAKWTTDKNPRKDFRIKTVKDAVEAAFYGMNELMLQEPQPKQEPEKYDPAKGTFIDMAFSDGWTIRRLLSPESKEFEGNRLKHCVKNADYANNDVFVYSLRDPRGNPKATLEIKAKTESRIMGDYRFTTAISGSEYLAQARGLQNQPADPQTLPYIEAFYRHHNLTQLGDAGLTGIAECDGKFHSVYHLPEDIVLESLDLSWVTKPITLPKNLRIMGALSIRATHIPAEGSIKDIRHKINFPEGLSVHGNYIFSTRNEGKYHADGFPAYVEHDGITKMRMREKYYEHGKINSQNGLAADTEFNIINGKPAKQRWFKYNFDHNEDGPAYIEYDLRGRVKTRLYFINGLKHNPFGFPSVMSDPDTDNVISEEWYKRGLLHYDHGPACIKFDPETGHVTERCWYQHGTKHNAHGPARISYDKNTGAVTKQEWYWSGMLHNANGPAVLHFDPAGNISGWEMQVAFGPGALKSNPPDFAL